MDVHVQLGGLGHLSVFPDETARDAFMRVKKASRPFDVGIPALSDCRKAGRAVAGLLPGDVVEVHGASESGKTEVLLHAVAHVVVSMPEFSPKQVVSPQTAPSRAPFQSIC